MSQLADLVDPLKRAVALPGQFRDEYPDIFDTNLQDLLLDAFAESQLDGFLNGVNVTNGDTDPDLTRAQEALIVIYGGYRFLANEIRNRQTHTRYEAGSAVFEQDQTASLLNTLLRQIYERKVELVERAREGQLYSGGAFSADLSYIKATQSYGWHSDLTLYAYQDL